MAREKYVKKSTSMTRDERRSLIFKSILTCVKKKGVFGFKIRDVAELANCTPMTIYAYFGGMKSIQKQVVIYGKKNDISFELITDLAEEFYQ